MCLRAATLLAALLPCALLSACVTPGGTTGYAPSTWDATDGGVVTDTTPTGDGVVLTDGGTTPMDSGKPPGDGGGPPKDTADCPTCCKGNGDCDDGNGCTTDKCDLSNGKCSHPAIAGCGELLQPCGPSAPCVKGVCDPLTNACQQCVTSKDCGAGQLCQASACKPAAACKSDVQCKATNQVCGKGEGACVDCNTHADCSAGKACIDHACVPAPDCKSSKDCAKVCDITMGKCVECMASADCPTGKWCSPLRKCATAICSAPGCAGKAAFPCKSDGSGYEVKPACDDGKICTDDGCEGGKCSHPANAAGCNDDNPCTDADACKSGVCVGGLSKACDDKNICTTDSCSKTLGCKHTNNTTYCNDGNACTSSDKCSYGKCKGKLKSCNDYKTCTNDSCDKAKGCVFTPHTKTCDDGNKCTTGDVCTSGKCTAGPKKVVCDDEDKCTDDNCSTSKGCVYVTNPAKCSDGKPCTADTCDKATGKCSNKAITGCCELHAQCDDKDKCSKDLCAGAKCQHISDCCGTAKDCDDGDACTLDACTAGKCSNTAKPEACNTKGLIFDFEDGTLQGWTAGKAKAGMSWSNKAVADGPKGKKAAHLGDPKKASFSNVVGTSNYISLTSPEIKLAAGQAWKVEVVIKVSVTGSSSYNRMYYYSHNDNKATHVGYKSNSSKTWTTWQYDVSAYAGVPFKFELRGRLGGYSGSKAYGAGIFVDEVRFVSDGKAKKCTTDSQCPAKFGCLGGSCQGGTCTYVHKCCTKTVDCNDGRVCTTDSCYGGSCKFTAKAGCCQTDVECNDNKICTLDQCKSGKCTHLGLAECCQTDKDCNDGDDKCTVDNCVSGKCQFKNTCCKDDKGCDDGDDKCTVDKCVGGKCNYTGTGVQGCCMPTIWGHSFDDNSATGMTFSNKYGAAKGWQVWNPATKYKSAKGVLYYGDPKVKNFKFSGANSGTATLKPVLIPSKKTATLRLWAYFGTEKSSTYDKLTIYGQPAGGAKSSIWVKTSSISTNVWHDLKIPLKSVFKGKKTTFSFYFNTSDGVGNTGLGVLIDDVKVEQACN